MKENGNTPPKLAQRLLFWFLRDDLVEEVTGDLEEKFNSSVKNRSRFRARVNYWYQVLNYVRPFAIRKSRSLTPSMPMFQHYFKISIRCIVKEKLYTGINISGLSIGLACFLTIMLYVQHEFSYNDFYKNADRIYRVFQRQEGNEFLGTDYFSVTPAQLASVMEEEFPEVIHATSIEQSAGLLSIEDNHYWEEGIAGDEHFFDVFKIPFVRGNPEKALLDPKSIVLTVSLAKRIFGEEDPIGQLIRFEDQDGYKIAGVIEDLPANSSLRYSFVINIKYNQHWLEQMQRSGWSGNSFYTFFELAEDADPAMLERKFPALLKKYQHEEDYRDYPFKDTYFIQPITAMYFQPDVNFDIGLKGNRKATYLYGIVAVIVLLLACVNYTNLAIARSIRRSREVGVRKVAGAFRSQLVGQFLGESLFIAVISLVLAVGIAYALLPHFGRIMERPVEFDITANPMLLPGLILLVLVVGFLSGSYPAVVMSSLKPIDVLKTKMNVNVCGFGLQRLLIVVQFAASITLIAGSVAIYRQLDYISKKDLGYDKNNVVTIFLNDFSLRNKFSSLANTWSTHPNVVAATISSSLPCSITSSTIISKAGANDKDGLATYQWVAGYDFADVFGVKLSFGRFFSKDIQSDLTASCIINEKAARELGWTPAEAVGKQIGQDELKTIIGVVKDFHLHSMHLPIQPLMILPSENRGRYFSVRISERDISGTLAFLERSIKTVSPYPFQYEFLDDHYSQLYKSEMKLGDIFRLFTVMSVLIASLGLFGLAAFMTEKRTKEIGIRKVLGASARNIVILLSRDFLALVAVAFVIAVPVSWLMMSTWLRDFAYRTDIDWWFFGLPGMLALLIATLAIGYQSRKAAIMNPVNSLKAE